ncbi:MAG: hypothetical protein PUC32_06185 [Oscillospiraceae bacterium]|nr:hypothetical protein [Oscillospiraceae bacterium]
MEQKSTKQVEIISYSFWKFFWKKRKAKGKGHIDTVTGYPATVVTYSKWGNFRWKFVNNGPKKRANIEIRVFVEKTEGVFVDFNTNL